MKRRSGLAAHSWSVHTTGAVISLLLKLYSRHVVSFKRVTCSHLVPLLGTQRVCVCVCKSSFFWMSQTDLFGGLFVMTSCHTLLIFVKMHVLHFELMIQHVAIAVLCKCVSLVISKPPTFCVVLFYPSPPSVLLCRY